MYKVLFVSLVVGRSQSSAENGKWVRRGSWPAGEGPHFGLNQTKKQTLPHSLFGFRSAQGSPELSSEPPLCGGPCVADLAAGKCFCWCRSEAYMFGGSLLSLTPGFKVDLKLKTLWGGVVDFFIWMFKILVPNTVPMAVSKYLVTVLNEPINWFLDYGYHFMYF